MDMESFLALNWAKAWSILEEGLNINKHPISLIYCLSPQSFNTFSTLIEKK